MNQKRADMTEPARLPLAVNRASGASKVWSALTLPDRPEPSDRELFEADGEVKDVLIGTSREEVQAYLSEKSVRRAKRVGEER
jgi:hypothetical protein